MTSVTESCATSGNSLKSLERMNSYPVITDSLVFALGYYNWIKSKNSLLDSSLSMIENTLKSVKDRTEPIAGDKLKFLDKTVCNQLERLEKICPIILEPSPPITAIHERSLKAIMWPFSKTIDIVSKTSSATVSTMSSVIQSSMKRVRPVSRSFSCATHSVLDKTDQMVDNILPEEKAVETEQSAEIAQASVYTKVKRLSTKTQRRLYTIAIGEINTLQRVTASKIARLHSLVLEMQGKGAPAEEERVIEGCENPDSVVTAPVSPPVERATLVQHASAQIEQLQDLMQAVANIKKYATTNTLVSLHFINTNLSLLKTVLIVNEQLLHQTVKVIDKIQHAIEYVMIKIKAYLKSQRLREVKNGKSITTCIVCDSDSE